MIIGLFVSTQPTKVWNVNGNGNWAVNGNWTPQDYPGGAGDFATIDDTPGSAGKTVTVDQIITLAKLTLTAATNAITIAANSGKKIVFLTLSGNAIFISSGSTAKTISSPIELQSYLAVSIINNTLVGFSGIVSGSNGISVDSVGTFELSGVNTFVGDITLNSGAFRNSSGNDNRWGNSANQLICAGGNFDILTASLTTSRNFVLSAATQFQITTVTFTINGIISGIGNISKTGTNGVLILGGANTFIGTITISTGTLKVSANNNLGNTSNGITIAGSAKLQITSTFSTSRVITIGSNSIISVDSGVTFTLNSAISGNLPWQKSGSGTFVIATNQTTTGTLSITATDGSNGLTQITGNLNGQLTIQSSANAECNSSIKAIVFAANASSWIAPGISGVVGTLTCTGLTMQSTTNIENKLRIYNTTTTVSKFIVNGNVILNGLLQLPSGSLNTGTYDILTYTGTMTNTSFTVDATTNNTGRSVVINVDTVNKKVQIIVT